jgi:hypothetical protein
VGGIHTIIKQSVNTLKPLAKKVSSEIKDIGKEVLLDQLKNARSHISRKTFRNPNIQLLRKSNDNSVSLPTYTNTYHSPIHVNKPQKIEFSQSNHYVTPITRKIRPNNTLKKKNPNKLGSVLLHTANLNEVRERLF